jgi:hypothetical protein
MPFRFPLPDSGQAVPTAASSYKQLPHWQSGGQYKVTATKLRLGIAAMGHDRTKLPVQPMAGSERTIAAKSQDAQSLVNERYQEFISCVRLV